MWELKNPGKSRGYRKPENFPVSDLTGPDLGLCPQAPPASTGPEETVGHRGQGRGLPTTYPQNQLLGRRGHEDAVAPGGAPGVHVLPALAVVLTVRVAAETGHSRSELPAPPLPGLCSACHVGCSDSLLKALGMASVTQGRHTHTEVSNSQFL